MTAVTHALELPVAPDPIAIAERLERAGHERLALLHAAAPAPIGWDASYVAADPDAHNNGLDPFDGAPVSAWGEVPRWIGVVPYESRRALERPAWRPDERRAAPLVCEPSWWRYPAVVRVERATGRVHAIGEYAAVRRLAATLRERAPVPLPARARLRLAGEEPPARHAERVRAAIELIRAGDLYQVNLARRLDVALDGSALALHRALARAAPAPFAAVLDLGSARIVSTSPELLLDARAARDGRFELLWSEPIKGTRPRGSDAAEDRRLACELDADPKERAELAMIVDVVRNDLGRVARIGSVRIARPPAVRTQRTVHHRHALVAAHARAEASRAEVVAALVPSGSVTGAPKVRAMEVIATLESARRGLYTGGFGYVARNGRMRLAMAIRTFVLGPDGRGDYWTGGGIVVDSDPARELEETRWKARQLEALLCQNPPSPAPPLGGGRPRCSP